MDPSGRPRSIPGGATCTACGASVPTSRIRILATRDDLAFVELGCDDCGSAALGMLMATVAHDDGHVLDVAADGPATASHPSVGRGRPISAADVDALRLDLAAWQGDLVGWLDAIGRPGRGTAPDR